MFNANGKFCPPLPSPAFFYPHHAPQLDVNWLVQVALNLTHRRCCATQLTQFGQINPLANCCWGKKQPANFASGSWVSINRCWNAHQPTAAASEVLFCMGAAQPAAAASSATRHYAGLSLCTTVPKANAAAIAAAWRAAVEATHVLINHAGLVFFMSRGLNRLPTAIWQFYAWLIDTALDPYSRWEGSYTLYTLR
ncbi:MAG: hypothetical protein H6668_00580 [Ardenticatenaceae bacterium]|nr:hypothetical protein [Ardenticatenaceae bacterium]